MGFGLHIYVCVCGGGPMECCQNLVRQALSLGQLLRGADERVRVVNADDCGSGGDSRREEYNIFTRRLR